MKSDEKIKWKVAVVDLQKENLVIPVIKPKLLRENLERIVINDGINFNDFERIKKTEEIYVLKIFHPSMPGFGVYKKDTHNIINWFYNI